MRRLARVALWLACASTPALAETVLDDFASLEAWSVEASEGVKASIHGDSGPGGRALCLDFDFGSVSGYAIARRKLPIDYPANFELAFDLRGDAKPNALQVKLVDASGENVWWNQRPDFAFSREWQAMRIARRQVSFAWGPATDHALTRSESFELAIARGQGGGAGTVCIDHLTLRETAPTSDPPRESVVEEWESDPAEGKAASLTIDLESVRDIGGLELRWLAKQYASSYVVEVSEDGKDWRAVREVTRGSGGFDPMALPDTRARYVRVRMRDGPGKGYALARVDVRDLAYGESPNAFFQAVAREVPRGQYPRGFSGEQSYWTVVGVDGGLTQGLLSEDGALEAHAGEGALEPMLLTEQGLVTWADVETAHSLAAGFLPVPTATWRRGDLSLAVTAFGDGDRARTQIVSRYTVANASDRSAKVTLVLALRPFQVNPPTQFLNAPGGVARSHSLAWTGSALAIDGMPRYFPLETPTDVFAVPFESGNLPAMLAAKVHPDARAVEDASGFPSAALLYELEIPAHGSRTVGVVAPLAGAPTLPEANAESWMGDRERAVAQAWQEKLGRVAIRVPAAGEALVATLKTALAHVLIDRSGPALQPGTRAYARSWIRDGALASDALLRMGHEAAVREFAGWFAPHLFASGKVPCCVDARGADPVPENDSHGEWIHLVDSYYRYTHDKAWLRTMWPGVARTEAYMESLRVQSRLEATDPMYAGLMPPSISHEGYSDKPAWSYWDDFWAITGYRGAVDIATALGRREASALAKHRDGFQRDLARSIAASMAAHHIDYIPGSADRGDFDPTSTTIALSPAQQWGRLPAPWFEATFDRYWREFQARGSVPFLEVKGSEPFSVKKGSDPIWDAYTPYELRNVGAFVRLGWRERVPQLLEFFRAGQRPAGWNQWAEVVGREARKPRFIGDMPHGWVAADYIRSVLDMFAYEREDGRSMALAAGVPLEWLEGEGIAVEGLRTPWGRVSYSMRREKAGYVISVPRSSAIPPGGFVVGTGKAAKHIARVPARVTLPVSSAP